MKFNVLVIQLIIICKDSRHYQPLPLKSKETNLNLSYSEILKPCPPNSFLGLNNAEFFKACTMLRGRVFFFLASLSVNATRQERAKIFMDCSNEKVWLLVESSRMLFYAQRTMNSPWGVVMVHLHLALRSCHLVWQFKHSVTPMALTAECMKKWKEPKNYREEIVEPYMKIIAFIERIKLVATKAMA